MNSTNSIEVGQIVQTLSALLQDAEIVQFETGQIVQFQTAQFPNFLNLITLINHNKIINVCKTIEDWICFLQKDRNMRILKGYLPFWGQRSAFGKREKNVIGQNSSC